MRTWRAASFLLVIGLVCAPPVRAQDLLPLINSWGSLGTGPGQFEYPYGIAVGPDGSVYVTDQYNFRIQRFDAMGHFLSSFGGKGTRNGLFGIQIGIGIDASGFVYVADYGNSRVQVFTPDGAFFRSFANGVPARDVAIDQDGTCYVPSWDGASSDARLYMYAANGTLIRTMGIDGGMFGDVSVGIAPDGTLLVSDNARATVWRFVPSIGAVREYWAMQYVLGASSSIWGLSVLPNGNYFLADFTNSRVALLTPQGTCLGFLHGASPVGQVSCVDVAVAPSGDVYVVDLTANRILHYGSPATAARTQSWGAVKTAYR